MWTRDSANKLYFMERPDKYAFIDAPQDYLVGETSTERHVKLDESRKQQILEVLLQVYFGSMPAALVDRIK